MAKVNCALWISKELRSMGTQSTPVRQKVSSRSHACRTCRPCLSKGSSEGVWHVAGSRSKKAVRIVTEEGHKCLLNMQVTDVKRRLSSVWRRAHMTFTKEGGTILHLASGQETRFHTVDNVCRLKASPGGDSGFSRQAC